MKVTVKRNLIVFHKPTEWENLSNQLVEEYGASILISWKMKRELGFTVRYHRGLVPLQVNESSWLEVDLKHRYRYEDQVHLDFFHDSAQSWFQLKYLK